MGNDLMVLNDALGQMQTEASKDIVVEMTNTMH
jgi:hypothetical protein